MPLHDRDGLLLERVFEGLRRFGIIGKPPLRPGKPSIGLGCIWSLASTATSARRVWRNATYSAARRASGAKMV
jgi:hypothetical protein